MINLKDKSRPEDEMKEKPRIINLNKKEKNGEEESNLQGYPPYPSNEDIYGKCQKDRTINPEDPSSARESSYFIKAGTNNEKDFNDDLSGSDLDIPGSELDDRSEIIGSEDEENNYYSLGGENHHDLDEHNMELNP